MRKADVSVRILTVARWLALLVFCLTSLLSLQGKGTFRVAGRLRPLTVLRN